MIIACDVDGVIVDPYPRWVDMWNRDNPHDPFTVEEIYSQRAADNQAFLNLLTQGNLYVGLDPINGALAGVQALRALGHRVVFATSCVKNMADSKWAYLEECGFLPPTNLQARDLIIIHDKTLVAADLLIDDRMETIRAWSDIRKRRSVLFTQPWNVGLDDTVHSTFWMTCQRAMHWADVVRYVEKLSA